MEEPQAPPTKSCEVAPPKSFVLCTVNPQNGPNTAQNFEPQGSPQALPGSGPQVVSRDMVAGGESASHLLGEMQPPGEESLPASFVSSSYWCSGEESLDRGTQGEETPKTQGGKS